MPLPELSPLLAYDMICRTCGCTLVRTFDKDFQGRIHKIFYTDDHCGYYLESDTMANGRQFPGAPPVKEIA